MNFEPAFGTLGISIRKVSPHCPREFYVAQRSQGAQHKWPTLASPPGCPGEEREEANCGLWFSGRGTAPQESQDCSLPLSPSLALSHSEKYLDTPKSFQPLSRGLFLTTGGNSCSILAVNDSTVTSYHTSQRGEDKVIRTGSPGQNPLLSTGSTGWSSGHLRP